MISKILLGGSQALLLVSLAPSAFAATIADDYTKIETSGQSYSYTIDLSGIDTSKLTDFTLEVTAKGDYGSAVNPNSSTTDREWFNFALDNTTFADNWGTYNGTPVPDSTEIYAISGPTLTYTSPATDDIMMTAIFSFTDTLFQDFASDGEITVSWQNGPEVDPYHLFPKDGGEDYVEWQISAVPIPGAVWLFISGLFGIAGLKRKALSAA
jgi:hypothetical protein